MATDYTSEVAILMTEGTQVMVNPDSNIFVFMLESETVELLRSD